MPKSQVLTLLNTIMNRDHAGPKFSPGDKLKFTDGVVGTIAEKDGTVRIIFNE